MSERTVPARRLLAVTPGNAIFSPPLRSVIVAAEGTLNVVAADDDTAVSVFVVAGIPIPIECKQILASGTTATGIVGLR